MKKKYYTPLTEISIIRIQSLLVVNSLIVSDTNVRVSSEEYGGPFSSRAYSDNIWDDEEE